MSSHATPVPMTSTACGPLSGVAEVPGDKSISHRSLILGAMCIGETTISGLLEGDDVLDTAKAMQAFGAEVTNMGGGNWSVRGVGEITRIVNAFWQGVNRVEILAECLP